MSYKVSEQPPLQTRASEERDRETGFESIQAVSYRTKGMKTKKIRSFPRHFTEDEQMIRITLLWGLNGAGAAFLEDLDCSASKLPFLRNLPQTSPIIVYAWNQRRETEVRRRDRSITDVSRNSTEGAYR